MDDLLVFNGIDGSTGGYLQKPESAESLARMIRGETLATDDIDDLKERSQAGADHFGAVFGVDSENLAEAGWGLVIADGTPTDVLVALAPLRDLRQAQAGDRYREYIGEMAPRPGESKTSWLARHKMGPGPANPAKVPYYLLLVVRIPAASNPSTWPCHDSPHSPAPTLPRASPSWKHGSIPPQPLGRSSSTRKISGPSSKPA